MNLLLLLLIIITIIVGIYLHNNYYNYSIQDNGNIEITQNVQKVISENISNKIYDKIKNNCSHDSKLVNAYLHKNNILNTVQTLKSNIDTELDTNLNTNYVDILMANSNLNIKIPEQDNPECIGLNNLTTQSKPAKQDKQIEFKTKKIIDWYLRANTEYDETNCDNFELFQDGIFDEDTNDNTDDNMDINSSIDDTYINEDEDENNIPNLVNKITDNNDNK